MTKNEVSKYVELSASYSIGYPLYSRIPLSPLMKLILEMQLTVFMYAGSKLLVTAPSGLLILARSVALTAPSVTANSYVFPVLLS